MATMSIGSFIRRFFAPEPPKPAFFEVVDEFLTACEKFQQAKLRQDRILAANRQRARLDEYPDRCTDNLLAALGHGSQADDGSPSMLAYLPAGHCGAEEMASEGVRP
jgi:hypothetical protein